MQKKYKVSVGQRFHRLVVIKGPVKIPYKHRKWICRCDCGREKEVDQWALLNKNTGSCGCWRKEIGRKLGLSNITHGNCPRSGATSEYKTWRAMIDRCTKPNHEAYKDYGGRGILVCKKWKQSFSNFLQDVGRRPGKFYSLDRKNNDGNYEPRNVKWSTQAEQVRNSRVVRPLTFQGKTMCVTDWAKELGLKRQTVYLRLSKGCSVEQSLRPSIRKNKEVKTSA